MDTSKTKCLTLGDIVRVIEDHAPTKDQQMPEHEVRSILCIELNQTVDKSEVIDNLDFALRSNLIHLDIGYYALSEEEKAQIHDYTMYLQDMAGKRPY